MDPILGIDLGTTNSVVSMIENGRPVAIHDSLGRAILPSVVGVDSAGRLLVGNEARNQLLIAPERTVKSIKRQMGQAIKVRMGDVEYSPQEISAIILRVLKERAEQSLGRPITKAVITVPAFFGENQRAATHEAGELAGLEVVRIINEPTAASLTYQPRSDRNEKLLVYDLGGGTFDVSIVQIESGVIEVLASHGDTQLGGDDFDQLLLDHICDDFFEEHRVDLRQFPAAKSRLLQAAEEAKKRLSFEPFTKVAEEFIAEHDGQPLHVDIEIQRRTYESLIDQLARDTLTSVDKALADADLTARQIDRVLLVGGSTRTPLIQQLLRDQLGHEPHWEVDPDLCVSLGAAVQGGLIAGLDVGPVLVDITPHTLGIEVRGMLHGRLSDHRFSPVIPRNTPLPARRSEVYYTAVDGQSVAGIYVMQGEHDDARYNQAVGEFHLEGLDDEASEGNEILVRFDLNLDGILTVTAIEKRTGLEKQLVIDNAITRFRATNREEAHSRLAQVFGPSSGSGFVRISQLIDSDTEADVDIDVDTESDTVETPSYINEAAETIEKAQRMLARANPQDAEELNELLAEIRKAVSVRDSERVPELREQLDDLLFYLDEV